MINFSRLIVPFILLMLIVAGCNGTAEPASGDWKGHIDKLRADHDSEVASLRDQINKMTVSSSGIVCGSNGGLIVEMGGPATAIKGANTQYSIKVANPTNCAARKVEIYAYLPDGVQFVSASDNGEFRDNSNMIKWGFREMGSGEEVTVSYEIVISGGGTFQNCAWASARFLDCVETRTVEPVLACNVTGPDRVRNGEEFEFCVEVANTGDGTADDVEVSIQLSGNIQFPDGTQDKVWNNVSIPSGSSARECWRVMPTADGTGEINVVVNTGGVQATSCGKTVEIATPSLAIQKAGPKRVNINSRFRYKIKVSNPGEPTNTGVILTDYMPEGMEFQSASDDGSYDASSRTVTWNLGDIAGGESRTVTITAKAIQENTDPGWTNRASVRSNEHPAVEDEVVTLVEAVPAMHIDSFDTEDPVQVGDTTTYIIEIRNEGRKDATEVQLTFDIPEEGEYVSHKASAMGNNISGTFESGNAQVVFDGIPVMRPGDEGTFEITVKATVKGSAVGSATLRFAEFGKPFIVQEPTTYYK